MSLLATATARSSRRRAALAAALVTVIALGACGGGDGGDDTTGPTTPPPDQVDVSAVSIHDQAFDPQSITVPVNNQVEWTNNDLTDPASASTGSSDSNPAATQHAVVFDDGSFDSGPLEGLSTATFTFLEPGTYA
jgi:plastocyanin